MIVGIILFVAFNNLLVIACAVEIGMPTSKVSKDTIL